MAKEIERKFLVRGEFRHLASGVKEIIQGYLSVDPERVVRVRISGDRAFITVKSSGGNNGFSRNEWEYEIPVRDAHEILKVCLRGRIEKTRYYIPCGVHTIEVDVFHAGNEGLVIAEIELRTEDEAFEKPEWLGEEVTGNTVYYNSNLI